MSIATAAVEGLRPRWTAARAEGLQETAGFAACCARGGFKTKHPTLMDPKLRSFTRPLECDPSGAAGRVGDCFFLSFLVVLSLSLSLSLFLFSILQGGPE